ncbi:hypothetical protein XBJ2_1300096 [Xenorhabdus bovienii str. Jollieti]|uniref:Uncharacterized protein n=1 Tax=Xenorhabdus bovienii (strain SS-2004) TaxID=406818 RepID=D3V1V7_XENBS|nr:hypothetical protein XBJ1_2527 [Xenorhabdus bovienii SS-2004]CDH27545.1 hypothetical protein XBJ2_1300096 [Xenorhabdus bovienii str. Jollieti]
MQIQVAGHFYYKNEEQYIEFIAPFFFSSISFPKQITRCTIGLSLFESSIMNLLIANHRSSYEKISDPVSRITFVWCLC